MYTLTYTAEFHAAHFLPDYPGRCANLHGHNFKAEFECRSYSLNEHGMVVDFGTLKAVLPDHQSLNDWMEKPPTTENLAREIFDRLYRQDVPIVAVTVWENERGRVRYEPQ